MKIVQLSPAAVGWRALHYSQDDDEVYEVPLVAFALVEYDAIEQNEGHPAWMIHAVGLYDLAPSIEAGEAFTFTDQDRSFVELAAPIDAYELEQLEEREVLIERIKRYWLSRQAEEAAKSDLSAAACSPELVAIER